MASALPDGLDSVVVRSGEEIWINLYPNALCNVKKAIKAYLDERIGKFCNRNNGILLSYTHLKLRSKHFRVYDDYPICRFPVSITGTYYKPEPGTIATGTIARVDNISVTCLIHGMIYVTIALRKSVNFDTWCALGQQIIFQIREGEMHYKGVRLNAIVTEECVDRMMIAFPPHSVGSRKRTFSSSSAESLFTTPKKKAPASLDPDVVATPAQKSSEPASKRKRTDSEEYAYEGDYLSQSIEFGTPALTSTQRRSSRKPTMCAQESHEYDGEQVYGSPTPDGIIYPEASRVKVEYSSHDEGTPIQGGRKHYRGIRKTQKQKTS